MIRVIARHPSRSRAKETQKTVSPRAAQKCTSVRYAASASRRIRVSHRAHTHLAFAMPRESVVKSLNSTPRAFTRARACVVVVVVNRDARASTARMRFKCGARIRQSRASVSRARASRRALARVEICVRKRVARSRRRSRRRTSYVVGVGASRTRARTRHRAGTVMPHAPPRDR